MEGGLSVRIRFSALWSKLRSKKYREQFVADATRRAIPVQIRALMRIKGISQSELAERSGLTQGVISRAANPAYGKLTLNTIIRIAAGFDVAFVGRFVPFSRLDEYLRHLSDADLADVPTFAEEDEQVQVSGRGTDTAAVLDTGSTSGALRLMTIRPQMAKLTPRAKTTADQFSEVANA
jgi:transcriptional regulator with XRE-family HTH domain